MNFTGETVGEFITKLEKLDPNQKIEFCSAIGYENKESQLKQIELEFIDYPKADKKYILYV